MAAVLLQQGKDTDDMRENGKKIYELAFEKEG